MPPLHPSLLFLLAVASGILLVSAASNPTSFCKCICGDNSTIIPLDAPTTSTPSSSSRQPHHSDQDIRAIILAPDQQSQLHRRDEDKDEKKGEGGDGRDGKENGGNKDGGDGKKEKEYRKKTCADCNKQYCLSQHLHICEDVAEKDVFTTCFQRDSRKDEAVVFIFIVATAGLLGWAALKPWVGKWVDSARERQSYIPVHGGGGEGDT